MIIQPLASGSKGNLTLIQTENSKILIDQGLSAKQASFRLQDAGHDPSDIQAIFVTHEHGDHINGVRVFSKRYKVPVYINSNILHTAKEKKKFDEIKDIRTFYPGDNIEFKDLYFHPFSVSHDAIDTVNFIIKNKNRSVGIFTDLGYVNNIVKMNAKNLDLMILEANHDLIMLKNGEYPLELQQRIKSKFGHLSNEQSVNFLIEILKHNKITNVVLAHLSEKNNDPNLTIDYFLEKLEKTNNSVNLTIAKQHQITKSFEI